MQTVNPATVFGFCVACIMLAAGIAVLLGWPASYMPQQLRITFGIVLVLFGIYRAAITMLKQQSRRHEDR